MDRFIDKEVLLTKRNIKGRVKSISKEDGLITVQTEQEEKEFAPLAVTNGALVFTDEELQEAKALLE